MITVQGLTKRNHINFEMGKIQYLTSLAEAYSPQLKGILNRKKIYTKNGKKIPYTLKTAYENPLHPEHKKAVVEVNGTRSIPLGPREKADYDKLTPQQQGQYRNRRKGMLHAEALARLRRGDVLREKQGYRPATKKEIESFHVPHLTDILVPTHPENAEAVFLGIDGQGRAQMRQAAPAKKQASKQKFSRCKELFTHLPNLDKRLAVDVAKGNEYALCLSLIRQGGVRPGSVDEAGNKEKPTFGATTLQARHVKIRNGVLTLDFIGKKSVRNVIKFKDPLLVAAFVKNMRGKSRFDPVFPKVTASGLRQYQGEIIPKKFLLKDLRTSKATQVAVDLIEKQARNYPKSQAEIQKFKRAIAVSVADVLGNTPSVVLSSYINPSVWPDEWRELPVKSPKPSKTKKLKS